MNLELENQHDTSGDESYHALSLAKDMDTIASCCVVDVSEFTGSLCYRGVEGFDRLQASTSVDSVIKETENSTDEVGRNYMESSLMLPKEPKKLLLVNVLFLKKVGY
jgi:hypothetical protein